MRAGAEQQRCRHGGVKTCQRGTWNCCCRLLRTVRFWNDRTIWFRTGVLLRHHRKRLSKRLETWSCFYLKQIRKCLLFGLNFQLSVQKHNGRWDWMIENDTCCTRSHTSFYLQRKKMQITTLGLGSNLSFLPWWTIHCMYSKCERRESPAVGWGLTELNTVRPTASTYWQFAASLSSSQLAYRLLILSIFSNKWHCNVAKLFRCVQCLIKKPKSKEKKGLFN